MRFTNSRVVYHDEHIRIFRELVQHSREIRELHLQRMELFSIPCTCLFERLDELRRAFIPRRV